MIAELLSTPLAMSRDHVRGLIWFARQLPEDVVAELPLTLSDRIALAALRRSLPSVTPLVVLSGAPRRNGVRAWA